MSRRRLFLSKIFKRKAMMSSFAKPNILSPLFLLFLHVLLAALKQAAFLSFLVFFFPATPLFPPFFPPSINAPQFTSSSSAASSSTDGDVDDLDLFVRLVFLVHLCSTNRLHRLHAFRDSAKDSVLVVQPRGWDLRHHYESSECATERQHK